MSDASDYRYTQEWLTFRQGTEEQRKARARDASDALRLALHEADVAFGDAFLGNGRLFINGSVDGARTISTKALHGDMVYVVLSKETFDQLFACWAAREVGQ